MTRTLDQKTVDSLNNPNSPARMCIRGHEDIQHIESLPIEQLIPAETTYECIRIIAEENPDKTAIVMMADGDPAEPTINYSYKEYLAQTTAAANLFHAVSSEKPVVAMVMPILPEGFFTAWGGCTAGTMCPINPYLEPELIASILNLIGATTLVTTQSHGPSAADALDKITSACLSLEQVWLVDSDNPENDFATALKTQNSENLVFSPPQNGDSDSIYLPTGGTTGAPKLVRLSHRSQLLNAWISSAIMGSDEDEVLGIGMPLFHVGGLLMLGLHATIMGQTLLLLTDQGFRNPGIVNNFWEISRKLGMTSLIATPTTAAQLLSQPESASTGHKVRTFTSGGSTIPVELGKKFNEKFGIHLRETWGATEFHGFLGCMPNDIDPKYGSVGLRIPFHDVRCFILDDDNNYIREAAHGEIGVIAAKGPCVSKGYYRPEKNKEFFIANTPDGDIWGSSGDVGYIDSEGYIWLTGRKKDLIIRGGHNIDPRMIEEVLVSHPSVQLAAAIGYPDALKGELPVAYVQLREGQNTTAEELINLCREKVQERAAVPVDIFIIPQLPLTAVGKIFKPDLRLDSIVRLAKKAAEEIDPAWSTQLRFSSEYENGKPCIFVQLVDNRNGDKKTEKLLKILKSYPFNTKVS